MSGSLSHFIMNVVDGQKMEVISKQSSPISSPPTSNYIIPQMHHQGTHC